MKNAHLHAAVLHKVFTTTHVQPFLPAYYPALGDAATEQQILNNIRAELQRTKNPHTSRKLARKRSILKVAVSEVEADFDRFHQILGTSKKNVVGAVERLQVVPGNSDGRLVVLARKKRYGGIPDDVKIAIVACWTKETHISPNRKDIR